MFGFFKNFLRKPVTGSSEESGEQENHAVEFEEKVSPEEYHFAKPSNGHRQNGNGNGTKKNGGSGVELPLEPILKGLPLELQPRVKHTDVGDATIYIPLEKILAQLSRGAVNISFGELRQAAPELFRGGPDRDRSLVPLPLAEILSRLNPSLLVRRRAQRPVEVPADIGSPFQSREQGLVFSLSQPKAETPAASISNAKSPKLIPGAAARNGITNSPTPPPPGSTAPKPLSLISPQAKRFEPGNGPMRVNPPPAPAPAAPVIPLAPAAPIASPSPKTPPLMVGLTTLAEGWPDAIRLEIVQLNLVDSQVGLPAEAVERALKQGRIAFTWKMLRSWIRPAPLPSVSAHDGTVLELPLKVVAPLFIARQAEAAKSKPQISIDEAIPNLFFGFPQPESAPALSPALANPVDTNYYVWDDTADTARVDVSEFKKPTPAGGTPGTSFVNRYATPNEIVSRAAALDGVAGALIALPDGLMVASKLPSDINGETLAAFLPQIFGKVSQCTKELRMGELNNLNFTVGNVPWKIFRVHAIFFAALGSESQPLPTGQLAALAAELDHKPK